MDLGALKNPANCVQIFEKLDDSCQIRTYVLLAEFFESLFVTVVHLMFSSDPRKALHTW